MFLETWSLNENVTIQQDLDVLGAVSMNSNLSVSGTIVGDILPNLEAGSNITLTQTNGKVITISSTGGGGTSTFDGDGDVSFNQDVDVSGQLQVNGDVSMNSNLSVGGTITGDISPNLTAGLFIDITTVSGETKIGMGDTSEADMTVKTLTATSNVYTNRLTTDGDVSMNSNLSVGGTITGDLIGNFNAGNNITLTQTNDNVITIGIDGDQDVSFNQDVDVGGKLQVNGDVIMNRNFSVKGEINCNEYWEVENTINNSGNSIALNKNGNIIAIGDTSVSSYRGKVYIYKYINNVWSAAQTLDVMGPEHINFGFSISLDDDGTTIAISAPNTIVNYGSVYIYKDDGSNWNQVGNTIHGDYEKNYLGYSVSLNSNGTRFVVGSKKTYNTVTTKIYEYDTTVDGSWNQLGTDISGITNKTYNGEAVSINSAGDIISISSSNYNIGSKTSIYEYDNSSWNQLGSDITGDTNSLGTSVSSKINNDGTIVAVRHPFEGYTRVYEYDTNVDGSWNQIGDDILSYNYQGDVADPYQYQFSLNGDGTILAIGSPFADSNNGIIQVYKYDDGSWNQVGIDITGETNANNFGKILSLNDSGNKLSVGSNSLIYNIILGSLSLTTKGDITCGRNLICNSLTTNDASFIDVSGQLQVNGDVSMNSNLSVGGTITGDISPNLTAGLFIDITTVSGETKIGMGDTSEADMTVKTLTATSNVYTNRLTTDGDVSMNSNLSVGGTITGDISPNLTAGLLIDITTVSGETKIGIGDTSEADMTVKTLTATSNVYTNRLTTDGDVSMNSNLSVGGTITGDLIGNFNAGNNISLTQTNDNVITIGIDGDQDVSFNQNVDISGDLTLNGILKGNFTSYASQLGSDLDGEVASDESGYSVSLSSDGKIVAIGAFKNNNELTSDSHPGHVRVYQWNDISWVQIGMDIDSSSYDFSGYSVSLSSDGKIVAIGAPGTPSAPGLTKVYKWNDDISWGQVGDDINGDVSGNKFGNSVSLSSDGTIVAIGADNNDSIGNNSGQVKVYKWDGSSWVQRGYDIYGNTEDRLGYSVSLNSDGNILAIGAINNNNIGHCTGQVKVYKWDGTSLDQLGSNMEGELGNDRLGYSVSLNSDGTIVAAGAIGSSGNSGYVRVYRWNGTSWVQQGDNIEGDAAADESGHSVSLSSDGNIVAIGSPGNNSGHVRVYQWNGSSWIKLDYHLDGEEAGDESGHSVSLNSDGTIVAIGAIKNDGNNGIDSGHVRVYELITNHKSITIENNHVSYSSVFMSPPVTDVYTIFDDSTDFNTYFNHGSFDFEAKNELNDLSFDAIVLHNNKDKDAGSIINLRKLQIFIDNNDILRSGAGNVYSGYNNSNISTLISSTFNQTTFVRDWYTDRRPWSSNYPQNVSNITNGSVTATDFNVHSDQYGYTNSIYIPLNKHFKLSDIQSILLHDRGGGGGSRTKLSIQLFDRTTSLDVPLFATPYIHNNQKRVYRYDFQNISSTVKNDDDELLLQSIGFTDNTIYNQTSGSISSSDPGVLMNYFDYIGTFNRNYEEFDILTSFEDDLSFDTIVLDNNRHYHYPQYVRGSNPHGQFTADRETHVHAAMIGLRKLQLFIGDEDILEDMSGCDNIDGLPIDIHTTKTTFVHDWDGARSTRANLSNNHNHPLSNIFDGDIAVGNL